MSSTTQTKQRGKAAFDKGWAAFERLGGPVNRLSNKLGCEAFCPMTLGHECDKAARILKSFCEEGFYTEEYSHPGSAPGPRIKPKVLVKIPQRVIQNCVGLAIFTVMRTGMWISGAGGSGVLIARKEDGSWSPPSGLLVHTLGVGFMAGIDIYDCVVVINNREALEAFSKVRVSLGGELSMVAGPVGVGGILESEVTKDRRPVFSYVKSRGLYAGLQLDGTVIVERNDENARFYGERLPIGEILRGNVRMVPQETRTLMRVLSQVDQRTNGLPPRNVAAVNDTEPVTEDVQEFPPPNYEQSISANSLYCASSPTKSESPVEIYTPQSPSQKSMEASFSPPLPPRPASFKGDCEKNKLCEWENRS